MIIFSSSLTCCDFLVGTVLTRLNINTLHKSKLFDFALFFPLSFFFKLFKSLVLNGKKKVYHLHTEFPVHTRFYLYYLTIFRIVKELSPSI